MGNGVDSVLIRPAICTDFDSRNVEIARYVNRRVVVVIIAFIVFQVLLVFVVLEEKKISQGESLRGERMVRFQFLGKKLRKKYTSVYLEIHIYCLKCMYILVVGENLISSRKVKCHFVRNVRCILILF